MKYFALAIFALFALSSCKKEEKRAEADELTITAYIGAYGLNAQRTSSGLYVVIDEPGTGASCDVTSIVTVAYKGYFDNNQVFDESTGATFPLSSVIKGWQEGIPYFKEGGSGKLLIPSALAYGPSGQGPISPNTVLIFDVELINVQ